MRITLLFTLSICLLLASNADAQRWKRYRHEAWGGAGVSNFLGEVGGASREAQDLFMDLDAKSSRYVITGGYRYKLNEVISLRGGLAYARVYGSDEFSGDPHRKSRNISFRAPIVELSAMGEFYFIREKTSNRYRVRGIRGALGSGLSAYVAGGIGGFWFNPRAQFTSEDPLNPGDGNWYSLQPLGTEGQGLPGEEDKYNRISFCLPMGIGMKYSINRNMALSFEYSFRLTFTDYIDDVSTNYANPDDIASANGGYGSNDGNAAAWFSNPAIPVEKEDGVIFTAGGVDPWRTDPPQRRGDETTNDSYMFVVLGLNYKFTSRKTNRPKF